MFLLSLFFIVDIKDINHVATISGIGEITKSLFSKVSATEIKQIIIEFGPDKVSNDAFTSCTSLEILNVSLSIPDIPSNSIVCPNTVAIQVPKEHLTLSSDEQGALYDKSQTRIIHVPRKLSNFIIPETIDTIEQRSFKGCYLKNLHFPSSITLIQENAFNEATIKGGITFSPGTKDLTISDRVFNYANVPTVHIPSRCVSIGIEAFQRTHTTSLIFDDYKSSRLTSLGNGCFTKFLGTKATFPQTVKKIPDKCFDNSPNLKEVFVPRDCSEIEMSAFSGCSKLSKIAIDADNTNFADYNGLIYDKNITQLYFIPPSKDAIVLPSTLEEVGPTILQSSPLLREIDTSLNDRFSFEGGVLYDSRKATVIGACGGIGEPAIADEATTIRESAFSASGFTNITFGRESKLSTIRSKAFVNCLSLTVLSFPRLLSSIESEAFSGCRNLAEVIFEPDCPLSSIPSNCFFETGILRITIPRNVRIINYRGFFNCFWIVNFTLLPNNSLYTISSQSFYNCYILKQITNPSAISYIGLEAFRYCYNLSFPFKEATNLSTVESRAFFNCLNEEVNFRSGINSLGENVFENNEQLKSVTFEEDCALKSLPSSLFIRCKNLQSVKLSKEIQDLEYFTFSGCSSLDEIDCSASNYLNNYEGIIYNKNLTKLVLCPPGRQYGKIHKDTVNIKENAFRGCNKLTQVDFDLTSNLTTIQSYTFNGCSNLSRIMLPNTVLSLGGNSFSDCVSLKQVPLAEDSNVSVIPESCFSNTGIETLKLPKGIREIRSESFSNNKGLKEVTLMGTIEIIGLKAFQGCSFIRTFKFCGKENICKDTDIFDNTEIFVEVSIFYNFNFFGINSVNRVLDPECSLITAEGKVDNNTIFVIFPLVCDEAKEEGDV